MGAPAQHAIAGIAASGGVSGPTGFYALAYRSTQQAIAASANNVEFDLEAVDGIDAHDNSVNPNRFTVDAAFNGRYARFSAGVNIDESATSQFIAKTLKSGADYLGAGSLSAESTGATAGTIMSAIVPVSTGDWFGLDAVPVTAGTVEVSGTWGQLEYMSTGFNGALAQKSTSQAIAASTYTDIAFATESYDLDGWFDTGTNTIFTIPAGVSLVRFSANLEGTANATQFIIKPVKGGADFAGAFLIDTEPGSSLRELNGSTGPIAVTPAETFSLRAFGAAQTLPASNRSWFQVEELPSTLQYARLARSSDLAIALATTTPIPWQTESVDVGGWADLGAQPTRLTVPAGVTRVRLHGNAQGGNASGQWIISFLKNGADFIGKGQYDSETGGGDFAHARTGILEVTPGDYFEMTIFAGTSARSLIANQFSWFSIEEVP